MSIADLLTIAVILLTLIATVATAVAVLETKRRRDITAGSRGVDPKEVDARIAEGKPGPRRNGLPSWDSGRPVRIVLGALPRPEGEPLRRPVAQEDVDAALALLAATGPSPPLVTRETADELEAEPAGNLILIGGPHRNRVVGELLNHPVVSGLINCRFIDVSFDKSG